MNLPMRLELALPAAIAVAFASLVWVPLGRALARRLLGPAARPVELPIAFALGLGFWSMVVFALGLAQLLYAGVVIVIAASSAGWLAWRGYGTARSREHQGHAARRPGQRVLHAVLLLASGASIGTVLAGALAPEIAFDAVNVHLPFARDCARAHRIVFAPNNWSSMMPALPLMPYVTAFLLSGSELAKLWNALAYVACGGVAGAFVARRSSRLWGLAAASLVWSAPIALYEGTTTLVDVQLALYSAVAVLSLLEWTRTGEAGELNVSALAAGFALGSKYHAAFWLPPIAAVILWEGWRRRELSLRATAALGLRWAAVAALAALPWYARAWWLTGNPVFPAANSLFRSAYFTPAMDAAAHAAYANEGIGRSPGALAALPWVVALRPEPFRGTPGPIFLLTTAAAVALVSARGARRSAAPARGDTLGYGLVLAGFYFYSWGATAQESRYLLPLVPLLASIAATVLEKAAAARALAPAAVVLVATTALANLPSLYPRWVGGWSYWHGFRSPAAYLLGRESADDYIRRDHPSIDVHRWADRRLGPTDRILLLNDAAQLYSSVPTLYSFTLEGERVLSETSEAGLLARLEESRITHVLLNYNGIEPLPGVLPRLGVYFFFDRSFVAEHLEPIFSMHDVTLYRVRHGKQ